MQPSTLFPVRMSNALRSGSHQKEYSNDRGKKKRTEEITPESQRSSPSNGGNEETQSNVDEKKSHVRLRSVPSVSSLASSDGVRVVRGFISFTKDYFSRSWVVKDPLFSACRSFGI